ncbi:stromal cell-derived factor 2-like protein 1 [Leptopilina boulardi]|uniref:stromal cell-derived factor 2-like protein 1 n=1 Tax=Leptopilina boulardi TaxID=63433 RepID=UPI0021F596B6|nr:stromal cell-derived factor 2-like protein 1 [Leptopilina boulardi]
MAARRRKSDLIFSLFILILSFISIIQGKSSKYVTCGSILKLMNIDYKVRLHSHDIKYGTGSGQQSVTGTESKDDGNSHWLIKGETKKQCIRGKPIKCGEIIRFEHTITKKNLHSHYVQSPLSGKQEVSAYGDIKGDGDSGDHWMVICDNDFWQRDSPITLQHVDTQAYLSVTGRTYGSPIVGQTEVVGEHSQKHVEWQAMEGLFVHTTDFKSHHYEHTEL